jgi:hypothetical protein
MDRQHVPAWVSNAKLAAMMRELADLLEHRGENLLFGQACRLGLKGCALYRASARPD